MNNKFTNWTIVNSSDYIKPIANPRALISMSEKHQFFCIKATTEVNSVKFHSLTRRGQMLYRLSF